MKAPDEEKPRLNFDVQTTLPTESTPEDLQAYREGVSNLFELVLSIWRKHGHDVQASVDEIDTTVKEGLN